jgi:rRNA maturation RNase YbeY
LKITIYQDKRTIIKNKKIIKKWITKEIEERGKKCGEISIIITDDNKLAEINRTYLKRTYLTDTITFNYNYDNTISGDIYISLERVKENSKIYHENEKRELRRVIIHGILHLLGYNDYTKKEKKIMRNEEEKCLKKIENV